MPPLTYIFIAIIVTIIAVGFVIAVRRNRYIRRSGIRTNAVVSRIEEHVTYDIDGDPSVSRKYFVRFMTQDGNTVEARLGNILEKRRHEGDELCVMYLPENPNYAIQVKKEK